MPAFEIPTYISHNDGFYQIFANMRHSAEPRTESDAVFMETDCIAILEYCMPGWRSDMQEDEISLEPENFDACIDLAFRSLRCGAVRVAATRESWVSIEDICRGEAQKRQPKYIFGWPSSERRNDPGAESVWVLTLPPPPTESGALEWMEFHDRLEGQLARCSTMAEYCDVLKQRGAIFYGEARLSPEVQELGLVDKSSM